MRVILHLQVCNGINRAIHSVVVVSYVWYWSRSASGRLFALWLARLDILDGTSGLHRSAPRPRRDRYALGSSISSMFYARAGPNRRRREVDSRKIWSMVDAAGLVSVHGSRGNQQSCVGECDRTAGAAPTTARWPRSSFEAIDTCASVWPHMRF